MAGEVSVTGATTSASGAPASLGRLAAALHRGWHGGWFAAALVALGAGALRLAHLGQVVSDPFYDAAVRSMTQSWHNFFFGAVEPSGAVAIDKPPVDLWLQVASVKLFGWGSTTLKLPQALAGTAAVALLFAALKRVFGVRAALAGALALAVLPIEVITARSDTMDAVMMALMTLALLLGVLAIEKGRTVWLLGAAAALGLAFNIKLLESLPALPPLALLALVGLPGPRRRRAAQLAAAAAVYVAISLAWLGATLFYPAHDRPYAYGSTNGSAWNAAFVFNGLDRLEGKAVEGPQQGYIPGHHYPQRTQAQREAIPIVPPSATRLLARIGPLSGDRLGLEALAGLLLGGALLAALLRARAATRGPGRATPVETSPLSGGPSAVSDEPSAVADQPSAVAGQPSAVADQPSAAHVGPPPSARSSADRLQLALAASLMLWLLIGVALFSEMARLHPRYTEALVPAVAGTLGMGVAWATERRTIWRLVALSATLTSVVIYGRWLLYGTPAVWWIATAGAVGALALAWTGRVPLAPRSAAVFALALVSLLAIPLAGALRGVRENVSDTNRLGVLHAGELAPLSSYLRALQGSAYYEAAFDSGTKMGELVVQDARPILILSTLNGKVFTSVARLRALADAGEVRYAFIGALCGPHSLPSNADCTAPARWVVAHGVDVSRAADMPRDGMLWRLP